MIKMIMVMIMMMIMKMIMILGEVPRDQSARPQRTTSGARARSGGSSAGARACPTWLPEVVDIAPHLNQK